MRAEQISASEYEELDRRYYKVENGLPKLIHALQKKRKYNDWADTF
jgi:hypothetical protein